MQRMITTTAMSAAKMLAVMFLFAVLTVGCKSTQTMSIEQYRALAEQGNADAQVALGGCYLTGTDVLTDTEVLSPDTVQAARWFLQAAQKEIRMCSII